MPTFGNFVYTEIDSKNVALGDDSKENCNGFVDSEKAVGHVTIPDYIQGKRLTQLKYGSLRRCDYITKLTLPSSIVTLDEVSVTCLYGINELVIPASVITIGHRIDTFTFITKFVIERDSRLQTIGEYFLQKSPLLKDVVIPSSVISIGSHFCEDCTNLKHIIFCGKTDFSSISSAFINCNKFEKAIVSKDYPKTSFGGKSVEAMDFRKCFPYFKCISNIKNSFNFKEILIMLTFIQIPSF